MRRESQTYLVLPVLLAIGLVVRLLVFFVVSHPEAAAGDFVFQHDEADYHRIAETLALSGKYSLEGDSPPTVRRPPGIILPVALIYRVLTPSPFLAYGYTLLCSLLLIPLSMLIARQVSEEPIVQLIAGALAALLPSLVFTAAGIWSEPPAMLFGLLAIYCLLEVQQGGSGFYSAAAGLSLSLSYLNRPAVIFFFPLALALLVRIVPAGRRLRLIGVFLLFLAMPIFAWGLRNMSAMSSFFIGDSVAARTLWEANNPVTTGLALPAIREHNGVDLFDEAAAGSFRGSWVPELYLTGSASKLVQGPDEISVHYDLLSRTARFVTDHPRAWLRSIGYKVRGIVTAKPIARSVSGDSVAERLVKRSITLTERWLILIFGAIGLFLLANTHRFAFACFVAFATAGLVTVLLVYVNARMFLPIEVGLIVPVSLGIAAVWSSLSNNRRLN